MRKKDSVMHSDTGMLESIDLNNMLLLFLFGIAIAMLGQCFQAFMRPGQIFNWWALLLLELVDKSIKPRTIDKYAGCGEWTKKEIRAKWYYRFAAILAKPLGLCPYCNSTWIAIVFFFIFFRPSFTIFLLIGIVWFFVDLIEKRKQKQ